MSFEAESNSELTVIVPAYQLHFRFPVQNKIHKQKILSEVSVNTNIQYWLLSCTGSIWINFCYIWCWPTYSFTLCWTTVKNSYHPDRHTWQYCRSLWFSARSVRRISKSLLSANVQFICTSFRNRKKIL
jgi:hypothetical protein